MTPQDKISFLGHNIGCDCWVQQVTNQGQSGYQGIKKLDAGLIQAYESGIVNLQPHLYSLDDITNEDAIEVARLTEDYPNPESHTDETYKKGLLYWGQKYIKNMDRGQFTLHIDKAIRIADYLRSRLYLLPFREYSVDEILDSGIVKIVKR